MTRPLGYSVTLLTLSLGLGCGPTGVLTVVLPEGLRIAPGDRVIELAVRDGDGPFMAVPLVSGRVEIPISDPLGRYTHAEVHEIDVGRFATVELHTLGERPVLQLDWLADWPLDSTPSPRSVTVSGVEPGEKVAVSEGSTSALSIDGSELQVETRSPEGSPWLVAASREGRTRLAVATAGALRVDLSGVPPLQRRPYVVENRTGGEGLALLQVHHPTGGSLPLWYQDGEFAEPFVPEVPAALLPVGWSVSLLVCAYEQDVGLWASRCAIADGLQPGEPLPVLRLPDAVDSEFEVSGDGSLVWRWRSTGWTTAVASASANGASLSVFVPAHGGGISVDPAVATPALRAVISTIRKCPEDARVVLNAGMTWASGGNVSRVGPDCP